MRAERSPARIVLRRNQPDGAARPRPRRAASRSRHVSEHTGGMVSRIDLVVDARDLALLIDQETHPRRPLRFGVSACAIGDCDFAVAVAEQLEFEAVLIRECGVGRGIVEARAEDRDVVFVVVGLMVAEPAAFGGSARGVGRRIKPEQNFSSAQVRQAHFRAVVRGGREIGSGIANLHHRSRLHSGLRRANQLSAARNRASI